MRTTLITLLAGRRTLALLAGGLVLGVGAGATTLASWTDHESVWGGTGDTSTTFGGPGGGLSSSLFNMQQSVDDGAHYVDSPTVGGQLTFSTGAAALSPGTTTYAYVLLRTVTGSVGGTVTLGGATIAGDSTLAGALEYAARTDVGSHANCSASGFGGNGTVLVPAHTPLTTGSGSTTFHLAAATAAAPGTERGVCFAVSMPSGVSSTLSGRTMTPTWTFDALSD